MISITTISALLGVFIPIIVAYISTRHNFRKHPRQEFSEDVESAREFEKVLYSKDSQLMKDRITQKFMVKKNINYLEAEYFYQYVDMELWVERYLEVKKFIKLNYDGNKKIIELSRKNKPRTGWMYLLLYLIFALIALSPFLFVDLFLYWWNSSLQKNQLLIPLNMVLWPIIFASYAFINLYRANKIMETNQFLDKLKKEGVKI